MNKARLGIDEIKLLEGEGLDSVLSLRHGLERNIQRDDQDLLVLTNRRLLQLGGSGENREIAVAELGDIKAGSVKAGARKGSTLAWGIVGLVGALILYIVVKSSFENTFLAVILAVLSAFLGLYLIFDYLSGHEEIVVTLSSGGLDIRGRIQGKDVWTDALSFLNRVFVLKHMNLQWSAEPSVVQGQPDTDAGSPSSAPPALVTTKAQPQTETPDPAVQSSVATAAREIQSNIQPRIEQNGAEPLNIPEEQQADVTENQPRVEATTGSGSESRQGPDQTEAQPSADDNRQQLS